MEESSSPVPANILQYLRNYFSPSSSTSSLENSPHQCTPRKGLFGSTTSDLSTDLEPIPTSNGCSEKPAYVSRFAAPINADDWFPTVEDLPPLDPEESDTGSIPTSHGCIEESAYVSLFAAPVRADDWFPTVDDLPPLDPDKSDDDCSDTGSDCDSVDDEFVKFYQKKENFPGIGEIYVADPPPLKRQKKGDHCNEKLDRDQMTKDLFAFKLMKCCSTFMCYTWLTVSMMWYSRGMFLPKTYAQRRVWIQDYLSTHQPPQLEEKRRCMVNWEIMNVNESLIMEGAQRARVKAFCFAHGLNERTLAKKRSLFNKLRQGSIPGKRQRPSKRSNSELFFSAWLQHYGEEVGDKMPFGEGDQHQIRLPFQKKCHVWRVYNTWFTLHNTTSTNTPLPQKKALKLWKSHPDLKHIKCAKYKQGFSKCSACLRYRRKLQKQMTAAERSELDSNFMAHIEETRLERMQYYKAKIKAISNPTCCLSIIMDAMDQRKTKVPFHNNPPKEINGQDPLNTKVIAVIVHGHGTFLYWVTDEITHDSNLSVECLRRTLIKVKAERGFLPETLYLQLDNGPDNKSKHFLAFISYLVEQKIFHKVKLSYLIVGHTHEDVDQYFSCISRFIKKVLQTIYTLPEFLAALSDSFKTAKCKPTCIEHIQYTYDTSGLVDLFQDIKRFDLPEKTGDKVHYFVIKRNSENKACMQYKQKRYSNALYPRQYQKGADFTHETLGVGQVYRTTCSKSPSKEKYWNYYVRFNRPEGECIEEVFEIQATTTIVLFPKSVEPLQPIQFPLAPFNTNTVDSMMNQRSGIFNILQKLN